MRFVSAGAAQGLVATLAGREGIAIEGSFGAVGAMVEKFRGGEACDVVILTRKQVAELEREGALAAGSAVDLGGVPTAVAVLAGRTAPRVDDGDCLRATLLAADAIYFPDPARATAGIHFAGVLEQLGIAAAVAHRIRNFPNGATAMREMAAASGHPVGCTQATEIIATPGVQLVGPLPAGFDLETVYTAAVNAKAADPEGARRFVALLGAAPHERRAAGFRVP